MSEPQANSPAMPERGQLTPAASDLAAMFRDLLNQVAAMHQAGRLHGGILAGDRRAAAAGQPVLGPPAERIVLAGGPASLDTTPPELAGRPKWNLPVELAAARAELAAAGAAVDPRRIDVYQLGVLLCRLASGQATSEYLRSPKARGGVPPALRSVIDAALGHNAVNRLADCQAFAAQLALAAAPAAPGQAGETPAAGIQQTPVTMPPPSPAAKKDTPPAAPAPNPRLQSPRAESSAAREKSSSNLPAARLGAYRLLERIGGGGMGDVYKALDESLDRVVAIKVLPPELARHADFVRRFKAEAMAIARLTHPNIVQVYAFGADAGQHFFAMQFVNGESLAQLLKRRKKLSAAEALPLFEQCLAGLSAAHQRGLIHRDIKPGNILLDRELGRALVADFGLVKTADSGEGLTATGVIMGTVDYIAPEQARGLQVDARSDLYSLGALMYQTLAGRLPFIADSPTGMIFQHAFEQPKPLAEVAPEVPAQLAAIVMRLLAKDPAQRYQTAKDVLKDLAAFRAGKPPAAAAAQAAAEPKSKIISAREVAGWEDLPVTHGYAAGVAGPTGPNAGWFGQWSNRLRELWQANSPEMIRGLQSTQQQVDGAVAEYERRKKQLAALLRDAQAVAAEFKAQASAHREAAQSAARRAASATDPRAAEQARLDQARCQQTAADFAAQLAEQTEQAEELQVRLAKVTATLQQLRSQRDSLQARLRAAQARLRAAGGRPARPPWLLPVAGALAGGLLLVILLLYSRPKPDQSAELEAPEPTTPPVASTDPTLPTNRAAEGGPNPNDNVDRQVAEMALSGDHGNSVVIKRDGKEATITSLSGLPDGPFAVTGLHLKGRFDGRPGALGRLRSLAVLTFPHPNHATDDDLRGLPRLETVTHFACDSPEVTDAGLAVLEKLPNLTQLAIARTSVKGPGLTHLAAVAHLAGLEIPPLRSPSDASQLSPLRELTRLRCGGPYFHEGSLQSIKALPKLDTLLLRESKGLTDDGVSQIADMAQLKDLELAYTGITDAALPKLARLTQLARLDLSYTAVSDQRLGTLAALPNLNFLSLSGTQLTDEGLQTLAKIKTLTTLHVRSTGVTRPGIDRFQLTLPMCKVESDLPAQQPVAVSPAALLPGLLVTEYPRLREQESNEGAFVPPDQLGDSIGKPFVIDSLTKWQYNEKRNAMAAGYLKIDAPGEYRFLSNSFYDRNALYVDNKLVCRYRDGEEQIARVELRPGLVPIASLGYVVARGSVDVQWAPPGQPELSPIPRDRLFRAPAQPPTRAASPVLPTVPVDVGNHLPGLLHVSYARLAAQTKENNCCVSPGEFGPPLAAAAQIGTISPWNPDRRQNHVAFGYLRVDCPGEYAFLCDGGHRRRMLWLDGKLLFDAGEAEETVHRTSLQPGLVPLVAVTFVENSKLDLQWRQPGEAELGPVPLDNLYHDPNKLLPSLPTKGRSTPSAASPSVPGGVRGWVCDYVAAKKGAAGLAPGAQVIDAPAGNGRRSPKGVLLQAPQGWQQTGTTWTFEYQRSGTPYGVQIIHPFQQGQVLVSLWRDAAIVTGGDWEEFGWGDPTSTVQVDKSPELAGRLPIETTGNVAVYVVSRLEADGRYRLELGGRTVVQAKIDRALPLNLGLREFHKTNQGGKFAGAGLPRALAPGEAGLLLSPMDSGIHLASNVRLDAIPAGVQLKAMNSDAQPGEPAFAEWVQAVAALPGDLQWPAVNKRLRELNPQFRGIAKVKVDHRLVSELEFLTDDVTDISPLRALSELKLLVCQGSGVGKGRLADLTPLDGLRLTSLRITNNPQVSDLSPLRGMSLGELYFEYTKVADLSPLAGMPLTKLSFQRAPVADLSPLRGMPLTFLGCETTLVADLSPLAGMPLVDPRVGATGVTDLSALEGMPITYLNIDMTKINDLSPLAGMPLNTLYFHDTLVSDISVLLKTKSLRTVNARNTPLDAVQIEALRQAVPDCKIDWSGTAKP